MLLDSSILLDKLNFDIQGYFEKNPNSHIKEISWWNDAQEICLKVVLDNAAIIPIYLTELAWSRPLLENIHDSRHGLIEKEINFLVSIIHDLLTIDSEEFQSYLKKEHGLDLLDSKVLISQKKVPDSDTQKLKELMKSLESSAPHLLKSSIKKKELFSKKTSEKKSLYQPEKYLILSKDVFANGVSYIPYVGQPIVDLTLLEYQSWMLKNECHDFNDALQEIFKNPSLIITQVFPPVCPEITKVHCNYYIAVRDEKICYFSVANIKEPEFELNESVTLNKERVMKSSFKN